MNFSSDNVTGVSPEIMHALEKANNGTAPSYGSDEITARLERKLKDIFECELWAFPMATGTACNALALSAMTLPYGAILCHEEAHINTDECGATEMYTGGAKLIGLKGKNGKLTPEILEPHLLPRRGVHSVEPAAISITQANEWGVIYSLSEIKEISASAKKAHLYLHMDGARLANALAVLNCTPAEMTWKAGVDIVCLGATKNGGMSADLLICFNKELSEGLARRRMRAGHLFSKMRFISAQLDAYFENDLWLKNARHANAMAKKLAECLVKIPQAKILFPVDANELFVWLPPKIVAALREKGFHFYDWPGLEEGTFRLVTAFNTKEPDIDLFLQTVQALTSQVALL